MSVKYKKVVSKYSLKDYYYIDKKGQVYRKRRNGEFVKMKPFTTKDGYIEYVLTKTDGSKQHVQGQILSMATHNGYPKDKSKTQVNHKKGKRDDNRPSQLEWMTPSENIKHSFDVLGKVPHNKGK